MQVCVAGALQLDTRRMPIGEHVTQLMHGERGRPQQRDPRQVPTAGGPNSSTTHRHRTLAHRWRQAEPRRDVCSHKDRPHLASAGSQRRRVPPIAACGRATMGVRRSRLHRRRSVTWATRSCRNRPTADAILLRWDHHSSIKQRRPGCRNGHPSAAETGRRQPRSPRRRYRAGADAGLATGSRRRTCVRAKPGPCHAAVVNLGWGTHRRCSCHPIEGSR